MASLRTWMPCCLTLLGSSAHTRAGRGVSCDWTSIPSVSLAVRSAVNGAPTRWFLQDEGISVERSWKTRGIGASGGVRGVRRRKRLHECWSQTLRFWPLKSEKGSSTRLRDWAPMALVQFGNVSTAIGSRALHGYVAWTLHRALLQAGSWRRTFRLPCPQNPGDMARATVVERGTAGGYGVIRQIRLTQACVGWVHVAVNIAAIPHARKHRMSSRDEL